MPSEKAEEKAGEKKEAKLKEELEKQELLAKGKVSLIIDGYNDIFSDFDSRPYSHRSLSDDFLREATKVSYEASGEIELRFLIPGIHRHAPDEAIIKKRLKEHFRKHSAILENEEKQRRNKGVVVAIVGFVLMLSATYIQTLERKELAQTLLFVVLEPAGWFSLWYGLDTLFYSPKEKKQELVFYKKMARAEIIFEPY